MRSAELSEAFSLNNQKRFPTPLFAPGNVRDLQHYIEQAVVTTTGPALECKDLAALSTVAEDENLRSATRSAVAQAERVRIVDALKKTGGNRSKAAKLLKISRASFYNKLRDYDIREDRSGRKNE